jgi:hypothetical protein
VGSIVPTGYVVTRISGSSIMAACGSSIATPIAGAGCTDVSVPEGDHKYQVTAVYRTWTATGTPSANVSVTSRRDLDFSLEPSATVTAGAPMTVTVRLRTVLNLPFLDADVPVTLSLGTNATGGTLLGTTTVGSKWTGTATFNDLAVTKAGTYTLVASSPGFAGAVSRTFTVTAAAATQLVVTTPMPVSGVASATANLGPIVVERRDQFGNPAVGTPSSVALSTGTSGNGVFAATVNGTTVSSVTIPANSSSVSFYFGAKIAGTSSVTLAGTGMPLSVPVQILPAQAAKLKFAEIGVTGVLPKNVQFNVTVSFVDAFGNTVDAGAATTLKQTGTTKCTIGGTPQTVTSVHGTATFVGLIQNGLQDDCRLTATGLNLPPEDSAPFSFR